MPKYGFEFDPLEDLDIPRSKRREALEEMAAFVKEQMLDYIGSGKSPIAGGRWKKTLSPEYSKIKGEHSGAGFANLELSGDLLDSLDVVVTGSGKLSIEVPSSQAGKAEGNNTGSYGNSKSNPSLAREFIPKRGQTFRREIIEGIRQIAENYED